ncbi:MAG: 4-(cytidine 5'-diphospho)-2-C-methyl-D-erythritol kinase [Bacteroidota bacterium]
MVIFPNCKINLGLNIIGRRSDGYHNIETVFYPIPLYDVLEIIPAKDGMFGFSATGLPVPGEAGQNLCTRAYQMLQQEFGLPAIKMHLHKVIPMGAGLGGGSSDGAHALALLNRLFELGLADEQLEDFARRLGSDCAFFIRNTPCYGFEKGDRFEKIDLDLAGLTLAVVIPGIHVSTAEAYSLITPTLPGRLIKEVVRLPVNEWKDKLVNDFEIPVIGKYPVIGSVKSTLYDAGALYAAMSGSGAAVFALFGEKPSLAGLFPGCFTWIT